MKTKYRVKKLVYRGPNGSYGTIKPGIYNKDEEKPEVWEYLFSFGNDVIEEISVDDNSKRQDFKINLSFETETETKPKTISNSNQRKRKRRISN